MVGFSANVGKISRAFKSVNALVDTVPVVFGNESLEIDSVDELNIGAVSLSLNEGAFHSYDGNGTEVHLDIEQICQLLSKFDRGSQATIKCDVDKSLVSLLVSGYEFELATIHPDSVRGGRKAGKVDPPAEVTIEAQEIQKAMRLGDMFSEEIIMGIDDSREVFYINSKGDSGNMAVSYNSGDDEITFIENERAHGVFSHSYLYEMTKMIPGNEEISLKLGEEYPAKIEFNFADDDGEIAYGLAPRIVE
ncbi:hypothetical protein [Halomicrococcus sp. SG-WS-1]|uniref:hypothetical protein n=1 Tax=Halomicrococcus sp. SG-WS-1 TaxID=3439057 RepID=UPI003F78D1F2